MNESLGIAMIGCGCIAEAHVTAIAALDRVRLVATMDVARDRADEARRHFGAERAYDRLESVWADEAVQAVVVCTPHAYHLEAVLGAAEHGKHVLVEKPMALSLADADQMIRACENAGVVLMVGQVIRYWPSRRKARQLLADGAIGDPAHVVHRRLEYFRCGDPWREWYRDPKISGGMLLYGFGVHEYDFLHWVLGQRVRRVCALGTANDEYWQQTDEVSSVLALEDQAVAVVSLSLNTRNESWETIIMGNRGGMYIKGDQVMINGQEVEGIDSNAVGMTHQMADFADCVLNGKTPDASGHSVRHTMAILEAVKLSMARRQPVDVAELEAKPV